MEFAVCGWRGKYKIVKSLSSIIGYDQIIFKNEKWRARSESMLFRNMEANIRKKQLKWLKTITFREWESIVREEGGSFH